MNLSMEDIERIAEQCGVEMNTEHNPYCIQYGRSDICQGSVSKCIMCKKR